MPTSGDLINLTPLVLVDTFETWFDRFNQIIDSVNPLQIYDLNVGTTGGLRKDTGISAGNYNGVVTVSVNPGPGIGTRTYSDGYSHSIIDFGLFTGYGLAATGASNSFYVQNDDEFIFNSVYDTSGGALASGNPATSGTVKKVTASRMLPPRIDLPNINFSGDVIIDGALTVNGNNTFLAANNLRVQDKQIEFAYQESIPVGITGATGTSFYAGITAWHFVDGATTTPDLSGFVQSYTGAVAGTTGTVTLGYPFGTNQNAQSFSGLTGYLSKSITGSNRFLIYTTGAVQNSFLSDSNLSEAGIVAKGASSDKTWLWINTDTDTGLKYNAWLSNNSIGVDGSNSYVVSRMYRSFGYTGINNSEFIYASESTKNLDIYLAQLNNTESQFQYTGGSWKITKSSGNILTFAVGATGIDNVTTSFVLYPGASGPTYSGITTNNFAYGFNSDQIDGAHARTASSAFSIPVADSYGRVDENWLNASSMRRRYSVTSHGFITGDVLRIGLTGAFAKAMASDASRAETIGLVSEINSANEFTLTFKGRITGLSGAANLVEGTEYSAGLVYFLSGASAGKMISDPDNAAATRLTVGQIRKPMLLATSPTEGIVLNYVGVKLPTPTDEVYLSGIVPVGTINPYAGDLAYLSAEWLLCDGDRYKALDYPDLYTVIGNSYYAQITFATTSVTGTVVGGSRAIQVGDSVSIIASDGTTYSRTVATSTASTGVLTFTASVPSGTYKLKVSQDSLGDNLFFVPDLRTRTIIGGSTGSASYTSVGLTSYTAGDLGGAANITLNTNQLPSHQHGLESKLAVSGTDISVAAGSGTDLLTGATGGGNAIDIRNPYLTINYVIRAKANTSATILTGHDHDLRYIRYDDSHTVGLTGRNQFKTNARVSGIALGSLTSGDYHDHDSRYVRYDLTGNFTNTEKYNGRFNIGASPYAEGDGLFNLGTGQTQHNHDSLYVRYDTLTQASFNSVGSALFRTKIGVYGTAASDDRYVNVSGDTMSGTLVIGNNGVLDTYLGTGSIDLMGRTVYVASPVADIYIQGTTGQQIFLGTKSGNQYLRSKYINAVSGYDSRLATSIFGDFDVWGSGLTTTASQNKHDTYVFGVESDNLNPTLYLRGGFKDVTNTVTYGSPIFEFRTTVPGLTYDPYIPSTGIIRGLTSPTEIHNSANKFYVDDLNYTDVAQIGGSTTPTDSSTPLAAYTFPSSGRWLCDFRLWVNSDTSSAATMFYKIDSGSYTSVGTMPDLVSTQSGSGYDQITVPVIVTVPAGGSNVLYVYGDNLGYDGVSSNTVVWGWLVVKKISN